MSRFRGARVCAWFGLMVTLSDCRHHVEPTPIPSEAGGSVERLMAADRSLVELDVQRARDLLDKIPLGGHDVDRLRARLAVMVGDCQGAALLLSSHAQTESPSAASESNSLPLVADPERQSYPMANPRELQSVAEGCARAMAGAEVDIDAERGVWVRFQNAHDRVLLPLIAEVADRAATAIGKDLGALLPRPLRIELVSDLASLAAVTGLPLEAAETTGTIAIARWGKVTLVSPRATPEGFPWQDTLAHELAHLIISRQSADAAPLWLQEGLAKREETRWRQAMPLDETDEWHREAKQALLENRAIGIDRLGASIALLPTPQAAETAYAEVRDFLDYWIHQNGELALKLLLRDLAGLGAEGTERALVSVSGYRLDEWIARWQGSLMQEEQSESTRPSKNDRTTELVRAERPGWDIDAARRLRLAELLEGQRYHLAMAEQLASFSQVSTLPSELAHRAAFAQLMLGQLPSARDYVQPERIDHLDGTWLAIRGRVLAAMGDAAGAETAFLQSLAFAPTLEKVACRGFSAAEFEPPTAGPIPPGSEPWGSLCRAATAP